MNIWIMQHSIISTLLEVDALVGIWSNIKLIMQFLPLVGTRTAKVKGINSSQQDSSHSASFTKQNSVVILNINQLTTPNSLQKISFCVSLSNV